MTTLSDQIRNCFDGVVHNPYQSKDKRVLFVCSMGILRSATAARIYARKYNTRSAGTYPDALVPLTGLLLEWADQVVFVNEENYQSTVKKLSQTDFERLSPKFRVLDIPDQYEHMDARLIDAFEQQYEVL